MPKSQTPPPQAFTVQSNRGYLLQLVSDIGIGLPIDVSTGNPPLKASYNTKALWDTGCSNCAITDETVRALSLVPVSKRMVAYGGSEELENEYAITAFLPPQVRVVGVTATACRTPKPFPGQTTPPWGFIVGMVFINLGDFSISNQNKNTLFSWRFPSLHTLDFVDMQNKIIFKNAQRNAPCPCGSGRKYKECHWGQYH
jgi:hypothetical protein